jgi:glutathione synthase/RimK-type ligase-like ATP-grasp enzyme
VRKKLAITNVNSETKFGFCLQELINEAKSYYDDITVINPNHICYAFQHKESLPQIYTPSAILTDLSSLIVRSTRNSEHSIYLLVKTLQMYGTNIFDPIDRFDATPASKLKSTVKRYQRGIGISSFFAFNWDMAKFIIEEKIEYPVIVKPINGSKGKNINIFHDATLLLNFSSEFFKTNDHQPLFMQNYVSLQSEYRAIIIDGTCLGIVTKVPANEYSPANAAQNAKFYQTQNPKVSNFATQNVSAEGILGVDIGEGIDGTLYIIEANYAPDWTAFQAATGINVAQAIIHQALERLKN